ncbi:MAG: cellulase family glycosylhydrolase, partial [Ruminococcus sp.]|nr:cellulase family glycosylhydrolase [Ruminococcus sp.]
MSAVIALSGCGSSGSSSAADDSTEAEKVGVMRDMTTQELIEDMGLGINLGNTFEATGSWIKNGSVSDYEKCWGSPIITEEMIKGYKDAGFGVVRVPANWSNLMSEDYTIDPEFDKRIHE